MAIEAIAVPTKRGRPKKAAIAKAFPLEPPLKAKDTAKNSKGPAKTTAAVEAAPKANGRTRKKAVGVEEPKQPKESIEVQECAERAAKAQARSVKGKRSTDTGEATETRNGESKAKTEPQRAPSASTAERSARVLEIGEAIIGESKTIRQLRRLYQQQAGVSKAEEPPNLTSETIAPLKADASSLEDNPELVTSPPSTGSPTIQAVDVLGTPTPPSLADPPLPALVPPHAFTSTELPQQVPLQPPKILTALAEELQHQDHHFSLAASPHPIISPLSSVKQAPGTNRMAPGPLSPNAPRKPHSAPLPPPQPQNPGRKAPPRIPFPSPTSASPTSPIPAVKPGKLKSTSRKYTMVMVALPIAIVTSWALFERLALGKQQKTLVKWPDRSDAPAATSTATTDKPGS